MRTIGEGALKCRQNAAKKETKLTKKHRAFLRNALYTCIKGQIQYSIQFNNCIPTFTYMYMYYNRYENKNTLNVETENERS